MQYLERHIHFLPPRQLYQILQGCQVETNPTPLLEIGYFVRLTTLIPERLAVTILRQRGSRMKIVYLKSVNTVDI